MSLREKLLIGVGQTSIGTNENTLASVHSPGSTGMGVTLILLVEVLVEE